MSESWNELEFLQNWQVISHLLQEVWSELTHNWNVLNDRPFYRLHRVSFIIKNQFKVNTVNTYVERTSWNIYCLWDWQKLALIRERSYLESVYFCRNNLYCPFWHETSCIFISLRLSVNLFCQRFALKLWLKFTFELL